MKRKTNSLISETSPYLLQHAYNPVEWYPWTEETLRKAKDQNKLIIISIGYSACHWCHVMEHECFEDHDVATVMNRSYINIKVDREERPDIDQVYMSALQIMTGKGGWPLNIVALPDGRPIWGGTYFPKENWIQALTQIASLFQKQPEKLEEYGAKLKEGMLLLNLNPTSGTKNNYQDIIDSSINTWKQYFDHENGGMQKVPKFMMPNNYKFLMRYAYQKKDNSLLNHVLFTLDKISYGGIYDHIGGGFSRYSTDEKWHIPHFEKMLYDNAQLVSLYTEAYKINNNKWYKEIIYQTLAFISNELTSPEGLFYSAIDADSKDSQGQSKEGEFYVWKKEELENLLHEDYTLFKNYYNVNNYGYWENDNYVLIKSKSDEEFCKEYSITTLQLDKLKEKWHEILLRERNKRPHPFLDDKCITSWNGLMISAYVDAYTAFGEKEFLQSALKAAIFISENHIKSDCTLFRNYKNGTVTINGYLEDYAALIESFIKLYNITLDIHWLETAKQLSDYVIKHFYSKDKGLFYFTSDKDPELVIRTIEYEDNVISSSNSILLNSLYLLSRIYGTQTYKDICLKMFNTVAPRIQEYPMGFSNWLHYSLNDSEEFYEILAVGSEARAKLKELHLKYIPNTLITGINKKSDLPIFQGKFKVSKTLLYACDRNSCFAITDDVLEIMERL